MLSPLYNQTAAPYPTVDKDKEEHDGEAGKEQNCEQLHSGAV